MPTFHLAIFLFGCLGGLLPDILRFIKSSKDDELPRFFFTGKFILALVFLSGLGGLVAWMLEATQVKEALAYGFAAPEILSRLAGSVGRETDRTSGGELTMFKWWRI